MVKLEDCEIGYKSEPIDEIQILLPGIINLTGIKENIDNYQIGHETFINKFGTLYVACDYTPRYSPKSKELRPFLNNFKFEGRYGWSAFKGKEFVLQYWNPNKGSFKPQTKEEILQVIEEHKNMRPFLDSFFNWMNENIRIYGDNFFQLLTK